MKKLTIYFILTVIYSFLMIYSSFSQDKYTVYLKGQKITSINEDKDI